MKILILVGGSNSPSNSDYLADRFAEGVKSSGHAEVTKVRVHDLHIDPFEMKHYDAATDQGEDFRRIEKLVTEADGILIATPIWNFGIPGNLKNLIDRMGSFCLDAQSRSLGMLKAKPFFLLYTGGTPIAAWYGLQRKTVSHLPTSIRYFGGTVIGYHYEERATLGKGKFGLIVDKRPSSIASVTAKGKHFAEVVAAFRETGKLPLKERFLVWFFRTGQKIKKKLGL
jgi:NAD(P)H-dependent FMN reductase